MKYVICDICGKKIYWTFCWKDEDGIWEEQTCFDCDYKINLRCNMSEELKAEMKKLGLGGKNERNNKD